MKAPTYDKERVSFHLAIYKKGGISFEIVVDADLAVKYKEEGKVDIKDILKAEKIFSDAHKGMLSSEQEIEQIFGNKSVLDIAKIILDQGELHLTAEYRKQQREKKRNKIIELIHANAVDPKTHLPHPRTRIENAMEEVKVKIEEYKKAEDQVQEIVSKIRVVLPIKFEQKTIQIHLNASHAPKLFGKIKNMGRQLNETWNNDGSYTTTLQIPAGLFNDIVDELNGLTQATCTITILKEE